MKITFFTALTVVTVAARNLNEKEEEEVDEAMLPANRAKALGMCAW